MSLGETSELKNSFISGESGSIRILLPFEAVSRAVFCRFLVNFGFVFLTFVAVVGK